MNTHTSDTTAAVSPFNTRGSLFRTADGKSLAATFVLITSLFLLWGFCNGMIDILNKHFQDTLRITKEQSGLVQAANYLAYFFMAIPAGLIAKRFGYKGGILVGLTLIATRCFLVHFGRQYRCVLGVLTGLVYHRCGYDLFGNDCESLCDGAGSTGEWPDTDKHCSNDQRSRVDSRPDCGWAFCLFRRRRCPNQRRPFHSLYRHWHFCGFIDRGLRQLAGPGSAHRGREPRGHR